MARERRQSYRIPLPDVDREATLEIGDRKLPVRVVDESAGGFAVLAETAPKLEQGQVALLHFGQATYEVRLAHVGGPAEPSSEPVTTAPGGKRHAAIRLGLQRVGEPELWECGQDDVTWRARWWRSPQRGFASPPPVMTGVLAVLVVAGAVPLAAALLHSGGDHGVLKKVAAEVEPSPDAVLVPFHATRQEAPSPETPPSAARDPQSGGSSAHSSGADLPDTALPSESTSAAKLRRPVAASLKRLPGAAVLLGEAVARELALSEAQQQRIRELCDASMEAARQIDRLWPRASRPKRSELRRALLAEARRRALEVLTAEQRARWEALQADPAPRSEL